MRDKVNWWIGSCASLSKHTGTKSSVQPSTWKNITRSIMVVRILPCLGTSSCPVVVGRPLIWWSPPGWRSSSCVRQNPQQTSTYLLFSPPRRSLSHSLSALVSTSFPLSVWLPCEDRADALRPKHKQLLLFIHSLHLPSVDSSSKCLPLHKSVSFPLNYIAWNKGRNSTHTSHTHTQKKK